MLKNFKARPKPPAKAHPLVVPPAIAAQRAVIATMVTAKTPIPNTVLEYGVLGMKWGKRKNAAGKHAGDPEDNFAAGGRMSFGSKRTWASHTRTAGINADRGGGADYYKALLKYGKRKKWKAPRPI